MAGIGRPDTVRSAKASTVKSGGNAPAIRSGWSGMDHANLGRSGKVPRGKRHELCGRTIRGPVIVSGIIAGWIENGYDAELVYTRFSNSESGAERYAAQLFLRSTVYETDTK